MTLIFPVFVLFVFGILEFGINWNHRIQTAHAAREVARSASVARMGDDSSCATPGIASPPLLLHQTICLAKRKSGMDYADVRVKLIYMGPGGRRASDIANTKNSVMVCLMSRASSATLLLSPIFDGKFFNMKSVTKTAKPFGGLPVAEGEETPLTGASWSFCVADEAGFE